MEPSLGRIVVYRSRTGDYSLAGIISAVRGSLNRAGVDAGTLPDLPDDRHVHLVVFTPGLPTLKAPDYVAVAVDPSKPIGQRTRPAGNHSSLPEAGPGEFLAFAAFGGTYQEFAIPFWTPPEGPWPLEVQEPGTWTWPPRV